MGRVLDFFSPAIRAPESRENGRGGKQEISSTAENCQRSLNGNLTPVYSFSSHFQAIGGIRMIGMAY